MTVLGRYRPLLLSLFRIMAALLILQHGTTKLLGIPAGPMNGTSIQSLSGIAGVIELVFGALLVAGLFSRLSAFLLSGLTAAAYWIAHAPQGVYPILNGGELAALYCFGFLYLAAAGPGPISLDALRRRG